VSRGHSLRRWVFGGAAGAWSEAEQGHYNKVFQSWLKLQEDEVREIGVTIAEILTRLDLNDEMSKSESRALSI